MVETVNARYKMTPVFDKTGKKLAELSTDKKRLIIAKQGKFIELFVNDKGELEQVN